MKKLLSILLLIVGCGIFEAEGNCVLLNTITTATITTATTPVTTTNARRFINANSIPL